MGHERLKREIQVGLDEMERGAFVELNSEEGLHAFFEQIKARGLAKLNSEQKQSRVLQGARDYSPEDFERAD